MNRKTVLSAVIVAIAMAISIGAPAIAEDDSGWKDVAELGLVATQGNSESTSFSFKNTLERQWDKSGVSIKAGGLRVETTSFSRSATGASIPAAIVTETDTTNTTAENYYVNGRYDRKISDRMFWYLGAGWDRNEFAGIDNRYIGEAGVGNIWFDDDDHKFRTNYGLTFTDQEDVFPTPGIDDTFAGARFSWDYFNKLTGNTTYENTFVVDLNLDETDDWRGDMYNGLAVAMNDRVALKLGLQLFYDNLPSFQALALNGDPAQGFVPFELDELDSVFTASVVINVK